LQRQNKVRSANRSESEKHHDEQLAETVVRERIRTAPVVDPTRPLRREHELTICSHYGIGEAVGRAAEVAARPEGEITATPPGG